MTAGTDLCSKTATPREERSALWIEIAAVSRCSVSGALAAPVRAEAEAEFVHLRTAIKELTQALAGPQVEKDARVPKVAPESLEPIEREAAQLAARLRSQNGLGALLEATRFRGRPTPRARHARMELGWITARLLAGGASLRQVGAVFGRPPSTVKKLADDYEALSSASERFLVLPLTTDAQAYVDRALGLHDKKENAMENVSTTIIRIEHHHTHEHRHVHETAEPRHDEPLPVHDVELKMALDAWERERDSA